MTPAFRVDRGKIGLSRIDHNGTLIVTGALTRVGVFTYRHSDGSVTKELRHPDDVFDAKSVASFTQLPITDEHPNCGRVTPENVRKLSVGNTGDTVMRDNRFMKSDLFIRDEEAIAKVHGGDQRPKRELSCGYSAEVVKEDGDYEGEHYDRRQTQIRGNHIAIVRAGRAGPEVKILLDAADAELVIDTAWEEESVHEEFVDLAEYADAEGERGGKIIGHTSSGKPIYLSHKHPAHNKLNAQEHREASDMHRENLTGGMNGMYNPNTNRHGLKAIGHHVEEHARARRAGDRSGKAIGKTSSGKEIFDEKHHPNHSQFTAAEHNDASRLHNAKFHQAQADRSAAEAAGTDTPANDKKWGQADDRMNMHNRAAEHHDREEARLRDYHLDFKETPAPNVVVLMAPRRDGCDSLASHADRMKKAVEKGKSGGKAIAEKAVKGLST